MADNNEVGKVSLGLEFDSSGIEKQLGQIGDKVGAELSKPLQNAFAAAFKGLDFKSLTTGLGDAVKGAGDSIMKGFDAAWKQSMTTNQEIAEKSIDAIQTKLDSLKAPSFFSKLFPASMPSPTAVATPLPSPSPAPARSRTPAPQIDTAETKQQVEHLVSILDNVNAKVEIQQRKLKELQESYKHTFGEAKRIKIQEQMVNAEGTMLRLIKQSDSTAAQIRKLENGLDATGQAAAVTAPKVSAVAAAVVKTEKPLKAVKGSFDAATKAATRTGRSFRATGKSVGKMGNQFTQAFTRIAKQVLVFSVLYKTIRGFQDYMNSSMKTNQQYVASLNAVKTNLATAFQPVFSAVMPALNSFMAWLAKATAYVAAFMASLFGTSYKQSFEAAKGLQKARKELDGYGKSAKKAGQGLSSLDEFNLIKTQDDPDAGAGPNAFSMEMPDLDIDSIQSKTDALTAGIKAAFDGAWDVVKDGWAAAVRTFGPTFSEAWAMMSPELGSWKTTFQGVFNDIIMLGAPLKNWVTNDLLPMWENGILTATNIFAGLSESVRMVFDSIWSAVYPIIQLFVTEGLPRITEFVVGVQDILGSLFGVVKQIFDDIWRDAVDPAIQLISTIIKDALDVIFTWWDTWGTNIMTGLKTVLDNIKMLWNELWEKFLKPITQSALNMLKELWNTHLKGLLTEVLNFVGKLATAALDIINKFVVPIVKWLIKTLGPVFSEIFDGVIKVIGTALGAIVNVAKGILKALGGVIDFIAGVFTGDWERAWNGIKTFFGGIFDAIIGIVKGAVNIIIEAINWLIRQINKIKNDVPAWVGKIPGVPDGISTIGFNIKEIPKLANGGIVSAPTLAMVGDNRNASIDPEVVTPLSKLEDMLSGGNAEMVAVLIMMLDVLRDIAAKNPSIQIGETEFGRAAAKAINTVSRQTGRPILGI